MRVRWACPTCQYACSGEEDSYELMTRVYQHEENNPSHEPMVEEEG